MTPSQKVVIICQVLGMGVILASVVLVLLRVFFLGIVPTFFPTYFLFSLAIVVYLWLLQQLTKKYGISLLSIARGNH
jgi:hypothetical protein